MTYEIFIGEIQSVEKNNEGIFQIFKEKSDKEKQESDE